MCECEQGTSIFQDSQRGACSPVNEAKATQTEGCFQRWGMREEKMWYSLDSPEKATFRSAQYATEAVVLWSEAVKEVWLLHPECIRSWRACA